MKKCKWRGFIALLLTAIMVMTNAAMVWADETDYAFSDDSWYSSACYYTAFSVQPVEVMGDMCRVPIILNAQHDSELDGEMHTCNEAFIVVSFRAPLPQEVTAAINGQPVEFSADRTKGRALFIYHQNAYDTINTDLFIEFYGLSTDFLEYINQTMGMENMFSPVDIAINDVPFRIDRYGNPIPVYTYYAISVVQTLGGTITVGPESAREGDLVTIEAQPDEGMFLNEIYVNDGAVEVFYQDGVYCFYMPASDVTVTAEWIENSSWSWSDCFFSATTSVQPIEDGRSGLIVQANVLHDAQDDHTADSQYVIVTFENPLPYCITAVSINGTIAELSPDRIRARALLEYHVNSRNDSTLRDFEICFEGDNDFNNQSSEIINSIGISAVDFNDMPFRVYGSDPVPTPEPCEITEHPESRILAAGEKVYLSITAAGEELTYQWQYLNDGSETWKDSGLSSATSSTLAFTATAVCNNRQYRCRVTDKYGNEVYSDSALITIVEKLAITKQPEDAEILIGKKAEFSVEASGEGLTYQWQYQKDGRTTWSKSSLTGSQTDTLTVSATSNNSGTKYRCVVTDIRGKKATSEAALLTVIPKPEIITQPEPVEAYAGDQVELTVEASGIDLTYQWQYLNAGTGTWRKSSLASATLPTFSFKMSPSYNGSEYRCKVTGKAGGVVYTEPVVITQLYGPSITGQPEDTEVLVGKKAEFYVDAVDAYGEGLTYQWQYQKPGKTTWTNSTLISSQTNTLSVTATSSNSGTKYRCVVTDTRGKSVKSDAALLTVIQKPVIITQPESVEASIGVPIKLTVEASGTDLTYQWQYLNAETGTWRKSSLASATLPTLSFKMSSSYDGRQYRCKVTGIGGGVVYSEIAYIARVDGPDISGQPEDITAVEDETWGASNCYTTFYTIEEQIGADRPWFTMKVNTTHDAREEAPHRTFGQYMIIRFANPLPEGDYNISFRGFGLDGRNVEVSADRLAIRVNAEFHSNPYDWMEGNFQVYFEPSEYYPIEMYQELLNTIVPVDVCFNDFAFRTSV